MSDEQLKNHIIADNEVCVQYFEKIQLKLHRKNTTAQLAD